MANINAGPVRFSNGGTILIGSDTVLNIDEGTLEFEPGLWEAIPYRNSGVLKQPVRSEERATKLRFDVKWGGLISAGELWTLITTAGASGLVKTFSVVVKWLDNAQASTGKSFTFANCYFPSDSKPRIRAGGDGALDIMAFEFEDYEVEPADATF